MKAGTKARIHQSFGASVLILLTSEAILVFQSTLIIKHQGYRLRAYYTGDENCAVNYVQQTTPPYQQRLPAHNVLTNATDKATKAH